MADTGIFGSTADVALKAGANVSATGITSTTCNVFFTQAESEINSTAKFNFSDNYAALNVDTREILKDVATDLVAINSIAYDMSGYTSRIEAEDMINVRRDSALRKLKLLKDKKITDFMREV